MSFFPFFLNWCIVDLQCCVNSYYTAKWFGYTHTHTNTLFYILFHYGLSQDIQYSSPCYAVGLCGWSILHMLISSANPQFPILPFPTSVPLGNHSSTLYVCEPVSVSQISSFGSYFRSCVQVILYSVCISLPDSFHLGGSSLGPSVFLQTQATYLVRWVHSMVTDVTNIVIIGGNPRNKD